jgi:hypothetical protein
VRSSAARSGNLAKAHMTILGKAAMLLSFDIAPEAIAEHDDWHTHEHMPERLSIPGFLRGTRWIATRGAPRYCVLYEVRALDVLTSEAYLARLNSPTPWTTKIMPSYRGMRRGLCTVTASFGLGSGHAGVVVRFKPEAGAEAALRKWLVEEALPPLAALRGIAGVHLLEGAGAAPMTKEQSIRGADAGVDWALVLTGYHADALAGLRRDALGDAALQQYGATAVTDAAYRLDYALSEREAKV